MPKLCRLVLILTLSVCLCLAYFADNIHGYYRFKKICAAEGGLRVLHPLRKGVGWLAKRRGGSLHIAAFENVAFVRFTDASGNLFDYRYIGGRLWDERSFQEAVADESKSTVYEIRWINEALVGERRASRSGYEVHEIATGQLMVRWYQIGYSMFDQDHTPFSAPSGETCYEDKGFFEPKNYSQYFSE